MVDGSDDSHGPGNRQPEVRISALEHPMVLAALSRMASTGAWQRILDAQPLSEDLEIADAQLLVAAGAITQVSDNAFRLAVDDPLYRNPQAVASWTQYVLRRALRHAGGQSMAWASEDAETIISFGRASGRAADIFADLLLPQMPSVASPFAAGTASFLDVGVGIGAISIRLVERFPGTRVVGLDVLPDVLALADAEVARSGLSGSIELRRQSVADLRDFGEYDLAWLPQPFIPRPAFLDGVANVFRALKSGGAVIVPAARTDRCEFERARSLHSTHLSGGSTFTLRELSRVLQTAGFVDLTEYSLSTQRLITAMKPPVGDA